MKKDKRAPLPAFVNKRLNEGLFIAGLSVALFILLSLLTYSVRDSSWSHSGLSHGVVNAGGMVGAYVSDILLLVFGYLAYLLPLLLLYGAWQLLKEQQIKKSLDHRILLIKVLGFVAFLMGLCGLVSLEYGLVRGHLPYTAGGIVGSTVASVLANAVSPVGALLMLIALILVGVTLLTGLSWLMMTEIIGQYSIKISLQLWGYTKQAQKNLRASLKQKLAQRKQKKESELQIHRPDERSTKPRHKRKITPSVDALTKVKSAEPRVEAGEEAPIEVLPKADLKKSRAPVFHAEQVSGLPTIDLLDPPEKASGKGYTNQQLEAMSRDVEQRLMDFGVMVQVVAVHPGPVITRFELQLAPGVKVSKITALSKDLARSLSVNSVRVVEVIPGKTVVGLELPNQHREMVRLCEVLATDHYAQAHSPLSLALGVDISGHPVIVDLAKMPHLLVAGTTGSGKSVGLNAMLLSLLFKSTPDQVRLILVDPKMLELAVYDGIPHLLTPVVTDMKEAAGALRWSVGEMERRYRLMASLGVRNLSGYNTKVKEAIDKGEAIVDPLWQASHSMEEEAPTLTPLPYVVVVIDELADMMMVVGKKVEQLIARIAQKARAAGIHLILATQRPSVDVLTGLIKSNVPTRMSFQVSSKIDSRTILDQQGAEQLLGHGDMLYLAPGTGAPMRVHGAFVDDREVHRITDEWRQRSTPQYIDDIVQGSVDSAVAGAMGDNEDTEDSDPLYDEAVNFVIETRKASISSVQRRLKVGYNRAARLIEEMERTGIVSAMSGSGAREVLVPSQSGE